MIFVSKGAGKMRCECIGEGVAEGRRGEGEQNGEKDEIQGLPTKRCKQEDMTNVRR